MSYLGSIEETSYLSAPSAAQYRAIMRVFYREYEKMHFQLYKEDVLKQLRQDPDFADYGMDQLKGDLEALPAEGRANSFLGFSSCFWAEA